MDSPDEDNLDEEFMDPSDEEEDSDDQSDVEKDDLDNFGKDVSDLKKRLVFYLYYRMFYVCFSGRNPLSMLPTTGTLVARLDPAMPRRIGGQGAGRTRLSS